ncbi:MAG: DNA-3-methyladenine glycosylase [Candidatus Pacebacteria bacterium]|nr:DNA-3-methyladenine glycosylase [Candidatus Paceibacterota bacterium]
MKPDIVRTALEHLAEDARLKVLIEKYPKPKFEKDRDPFEALCRAIVGQQLSVKAATTIYKRFITLYGNQLTPRKVAKTSIEKFRSVGVSNQKTGYLLDLSKKFLDGTVAPKRFSTMSDEEIRGHLVAVKGIGTWTADMFLMFTLHRPDVLPTGDLGTQKAMQKLFKLKTLPTPEKMQKLAEPWRPYRTLACRYLWDFLDNR